MNPNDSGVAKWSTLRSVRSVAFGRPSTSGSPGPAKSRSPITTKRRAGDAWPASPAKRRSPGPLHHRGQRERCRCRAGWRTGRTAATGCRPGRRGPRGRRRSAGARASSASNTLRPMPASTSRLKRCGCAHGQAQQRHRPEREADRVDRLVGQRVDHPRRQVGVGLRVVRLGCGAVAEQVDADHRRGRRRASSSVNPLRCHVDSNEPPQPWTRTTGGATPQPYRPQVVTDGVRRP